MGAGFQETSLVTGGLELSVSSPEFPEGGEGLSWSAMANDLINPVCSETYLKRSLEFGGLLGGRENGGLGEVMLLQRGQKLRAFFPHLLYIYLQFGRSWVILLSIIW